MKKRILCLFMVAQSAFLASQSVEIENVEKIAEVRALRNQTFMSQLKISSSDSSTFFTQYDAHLVDLRKVKRAFRKKWALKALPSLSEKEAKEYYQDALNLQNQEITIIDAYIQSVAKKWGWTTAIQVKTLEKEIQPQLLKKANDLKIQKKSKVKKK